MIDCHVDELKLFHQLFIVYNGNASVSDETLVRIIKSNKLQIKLENCSKLFSSSAQRATISETIPGPLVNNNDNEIKNKSSNCFANKFKFSLSKCNVSHSSLSADMILCNDFRSSSTTLTLTVSLFESFSFDSKIFFSILIRLISAFIILIAINEAAFIRSIIWLNVDENFNHDGQYNEKSEFNHDVNNNNNKFDDKIQTLSN
ncbi:hypothetical protein DERP_005164 [Dermatophagoides pteronyssinus]|uniref:Uncharacterized protein n=1 Tax=Dermatophagoides pteronyssinus TaxID=6956 RepID=A0ABQ8JM18_DERPT|nr:hypothetical protein DERP_005164 [Dermatophagoides pteronyssinus]